MCVCEKLARAYSGCVTVQNIFQVPKLIRLARLRAGLSQKALALSVGVDQSFLCALEKGRRRVHARELLDAIAQTLGLAPRDRGELVWAWGHDRVVIEAQLAGLPETDQRLISAVLFAAHHLDRTELVGLERTIKSATRSKRELQALADQSTRSEEEASMS